MPALVPVISTFDITDLLTLCGNPQDVFLVSFVLFVAEFSVFFVAKRSCRA